ncbi:MAG TPA: hypothetical protein VFE58_10500 [Tepidisphaeraceae bacterium]|jgi:hypothetical protein|nr:hypothetical protein [Tepidisphaeraceae bacterium]
MKAERRHELQTNDLAKKIIQAPDYFKIYGTRITLGVVVVVAVVLLVNYRLRAKREDLAVSQQGVAEAREAVMQLGSPNLMGPPEQVAVRRRELFSNAMQAMDRVNERSEDSKLLAQAAVLRGDLYWTLANLPALPGATTRESLQVEPKADVALQQAESAYRRVLDTYADEKLPAMTARFGLAAVAENEGKWQDARRQYDAINGDAKIEAVYKTEAKIRLQVLAQLEKGVYLAQAAATTEPASSATTQAVTGK